MLDQINFMVKSTEGMRMSQPPPAYKASTNKVADDNLKEEISSFNDLNQLTKVDQNEQKEEIEFPELDQTTVSINGKEYIKHVVNSTVIIFLTYFYRL
jgi:hypothetical protein